MSNLSVFTTDTGVELVIDTQTGAAFATQAGYCRMSGANKSTVSMRLKAVQPGIVKNATLPTAGGMQGVQLLPSKLIFKWMIKDNPELAAEMGEVGATVFLHKMAGYEISSTATKPKELEQFVSVNDVQLKLLEFMNDSQNRMLDSNIEIMLKAKLAEVLFEKKPESLKTASDREKLEMQWKDEFNRTPATLGSGLRLSAHQVNLLLMDIGFQVRNPEKKSDIEPDYIITEPGKQYGAWDGSTPDIKWSSGTFDMLRARLIEMEESGL